MCFLIYKVELAMNKIFIILSLVLLASCGLSQDEKENIAAITCSIMSETRNMDAAVRVSEMNEAREKIGGEPFLDGDDAIIEAFEYELCQELVLNENYDDTLQRGKDAKREMERIAAEKRIADIKPTVKEEFHNNGKLKSRANYQPKTDGGKLDGLYESYYRNGQLDRKGNYKDGRPDGLFIGYYENGQRAFKVNYKNGREEGIYKWYDEQGQLTSKSCLKNFEMVDMSYCEK